MMQWLSVLLCLEFAPYLFAHLVQGRLSIIAVSVRSGGLNYPYFLFYAMQSATPSPATASCEQDLYTDSKDPQALT